MTPAQTGGQDGRTGCQGDGVHCKIDQTSENI